MLESRAFDLLVRSACTVAFSDGGFGRSARCFSSACAHLGLVRTGPSGWYWCRAEVYHTDLRRFALSAPHHATER